MNFEQILAKCDAYPVLVRGTDSDEILKLIGRNEVSFPMTIYAHPVYEGFEKAGVIPQKPIPENYSLMRLRDEALGCGTSEATHRVFFEIEENPNELGVVLYYHPKILGYGYEQDLDVKDRPDQLLGVKVKINDFDPSSIIIAEPLSRVDYNKLEKVLGGILTEPRFSDYKDYVGYFLSDQCKVITGDGLFPS